MLEGRLKGQKSKRGKSAPGVSLLHLSEAALEEAKAKPCTEEDEEARNKEKQRETKQERKKNKEKQRVKQSKWQEATARHSKQIQHAVP